LKYRYRLIVRVNDRVSSSSSSSAEIRCMTNTGVDAAVTALGSRLGTLRLQIQLGLGLGLWLALAFGLGMLELKRAILFLTKCTKWFE